MIVFLTADCAVEEIFYSIYLKFNFLLCTGSKFSWLRHLRFYFPSRLMVIRGMYWEMLNGALDKFVQQPEEGCIISQPPTMLIKFTQVKSKHPPSYFELTCWNTGWILLSSKTPPTSRSMSFFGVTTSSIRIVVSWKTPEIPPSS